jgi:hypothetical protein
MGERNLGSLLPGIKYGHKVYPYELLGAGMNIFGTLWFVDATSGSDDDIGTSPDHAFATIQKAVTTQIANSTGLGDGILVFPGTYAESITGALTKVKLIGLGASQVSVRPTAGSGYAGVITDSLITGIDWRTPSLSSLTYPALQATDLIGSEISNCSFTGTTNPTNQDTGTCGIQIGAITETSWEQMVNSRIVNNVFKDNGSRTSELSHGIRFGYLASSSYSSTRINRYSEIAYNHIQVEYKGIWMQVNRTNHNGSSVHHNWVHSAQGGDAATSDVGIHADDANADATSLLMVTDNRVMSNEDAIGGVNTNAVQGNIIGVNGAAPTSETGQQ